MKKTLVASAMAVAFGISGAAFASSTNQTTDQATGIGDNTSNSASNISSNDNNSRTYTDNSNYNSTKRISCRYCSRNIV